MVATPQRVTVFGTGAMASLLGARLARSAPGSVTLVGTWPEALAAIARDGLTVEEDGERWLARPEASTLEAAPTADGVTVTTLHSAKGLEWPVVFIIGASEGNLPIVYADTDARIEEELYRGGAGVIAGVSGRGADLKLLLHLDDGSMFNLLATHAKLEVLPDE